MKIRRPASALFAAAIALSVGGAWAQTTWVDEISNSLAFPDCHGTRVVVNRMGPPTARSTFVVSL